MKTWKHYMSVFWCIVLWNLLKPQNLLLFTFQWHRYHWIVININLSKRFCSLGFYFFIAVHFLNEAIELSQAYTKTYLFINKVRECGVEPTERLFLLITATATYEPTVETNNFCRRTKMIYDFGTNLIKPEMVKPHARLTKSVSEGNYKSTEWHA